MARLGLVRSFQISRGVSPPDRAGERAGRAPAQARPLVRFLALERALRELDDARRELLARGRPRRSSRDTLAVELPYGRKRALEIATTLALDPELMLLDEPTAGMGHEDVDRIAALIQRVGDGAHGADGGAQPRRGRRALATASPCCARGEVLAEGDYADRVEEPAGDRRLPGDRSMLRRCCSVEGLHAWYGESHVLHGVDFEVREGEVVTLLGRNGAGKTTTLKSIMGLVAAARGLHRRSRARRRSALPPNRIARLGIALLPRGARHLRLPQRRGEPAAAADGARQAA